ncbi:MFS transporter [Amycolatopsis lurida]
MAAQQNAKTPRALTGIVWPVAAYSIIYTLLFLIVNLMPIYTGVFIDVGGLTEVDAGWVNSAYLAAMTVAAIAFTVVLTRFPLRRLGFVATAVMVVGLCIPLSVSEPGAVVVAMAITGIGNGALFAIVNASAAMERHPVLVYGAGIVLSNLVTAAVPSPLYDAVDVWAVSGLFVPPLALIPLVLVSLLVLKRRSAPTDTASGPARATMSGAYNGTAVAVLVAIFLANLLLMTYYAFADRLLVNAGSDSDAIASVFTIVYFAAAICGVIAMAMARWPSSLVTGATAFTALLVVSILVATMSKTPWLVAIAIVVAGGVSMLNMSVQLGVAADIDPSGRVAAAASGAQFAAWTLGPILGGWLIEGTGFGGIAVLVAVLGVLSVALLILVDVRRRGRHTATAPGDC